MRIDSGAGGDGSGVEWLQRVRRRSVARLSAQHSRRKDRHLIGCWRPWSQGRQPGLARSLFLYLVPLQHFGCLSQPTCCGVRPSTTTIQPGYNRSTTKVQPHTMVNKRHFTPQPSHGRPHGGTPVDACVRGTEGWLMRLMESTQNRWCERCCVSSVVCSIDGLTWSGGVSMLFMA